jgi:Kef-type K+ transport system membrane component KefB
MAGGPEPILLSILIIILGGKLGGELMERLKQPAVLGELLIGVLLGASLLGGFVGLPDFAVEQEFHQLEDAWHDGGAAEESAFFSFFESNQAELGAIEILSLLAMLGVILLLFEVGLESDIKELTKVGASSLIVGLIGIVVSFAVGYGFSWLLSGWWPAWQAANAAISNNLLHVFVGATLTATSVGITARVLGDMGRLSSNESRIILGAAVIDDIGGLIILAIVGSLITASLSGEPFSTLAIFIIAAKAIGFLLVSVVVGIKFVPKAFDYLVDKFRIQGFPVALAVGFALLMAYLATVFELADIVGAFAGGLLIAQSKHNHRIFQELRPIAAIFVTFFFVTLGMKVDLRDLGDNVGLMLLASLVLILLAMAAKLASGLGVTKGTEASKLVVGVGMSPRGEVGLIFASIGLALGIIAGWQYTMIIIVVMGTTFITPIWLGKLKHRFIGAGKAGHAQSVEDAAHIMDP